MSFFIEQVVISSEKSNLDIKLVHSFLSNSYWAKNIPIQTVGKSIENSLCYGAFYNNAQIGFARVVTDEVSFAYLADVFVLPEFNGRGVAKKMIESLLSDERTQGVRRFMLATKDAQSLYEQFDFELLDPEDLIKVMQIRRAISYGSA